jgi:hypothetical protein
VHAGDTMTTEPLTLVLLHLSAHSKGRVGLRLCHADSGGSRDAGRCRHACLEEGPGGSHTQVSVMSFPCTPSDAGTGIRHALLLH